jgi:hypothetical protein
MRGLLAEMEMANGARGNPGGQGAPIVRSRDATAQTLSDLGITKSQSSRWRSASLRCLRRRSNDGALFRVDPDAEAIAFCTQAGAIHFYTFCCGSLVLSGCFEAS